MEISPAHTKISLTCFHRDQFTTHDAPISVRHTINPLYTCSLQVVLHCVVNWIHGPGMMGNTRAASYNHLDFSFSHDFRYSLWYLSVRHCDPFPSTHLQRHVGYSRDQYKRRANAECRPLLREATGSQQCHRHFDLSTTRKSEDGWASTFCRLHRRSSRKA